MKSFWMGIRGLFFRNSAERDLEEEMRFHLEMQEEAFIAQGMGREEARKEALRVFGGIEQHKEAYREGIGLGLILDTVKDLRLAVRRALENKAFSVGIVLMYAFGIGISATVFTLFNAFVLEPLPFSESENLVAIRERNLDLRYNSFSVSNPNFIDWRNELDAFEDIAATKAWMSNLGLEGAAGGARSVNVLGVTEGYFNILKVKMALGRVFSVDEYVVGNPGVAVLSNRLWVSEFQGDEDVIGKTIRLDGISHQIVGVLPVELNRLATQDVHLPIALEYKDRLDHRLEVLGRIKSGVSLDQASFDLGRVVNGIVETHPSDMKGWDAFLTPLKTHWFGDMQENAKILLIAVSLLMLIICLNVSGMNLAQSTQRLHEFAIRVSLGASWWRVFRQLVTENLLLALMGVGMSIVVAGVCLKFSLGYVRDRAGEYTDLPLNVDTLAVMGGIVVFASLLGGFFPMIQVMKTNQGDSLKMGGRSVAGSRNRMFRGLVVGEIALAFTVVVGAALLLDGYKALLKAPLGFNMDGVAMSRSMMSQAKFPNWESRRDYMTRMIAEIETSPAIDRAAWISSAPFISSDTWNEFGPIAGSQLESGEVISARWRITGVGFFDVMGIRLLHGREFNGTDSKSESIPLVISESMAKRIWGKTDVVGYELELWFGDRPSRIVGVAEDIEWQIASDSTDVVYLALAKNYWWPAHSLMVKYTGSDDATQNEVMRAAKRVDPDQALGYYRPMREKIEGARSGYELSILAMNVFAGMALFLSLTGVYGLNACIVSKQRREIGIRCSLGALKGNVIKSFMWESLRLSAIGVLCGSLGTIFFVRTIEDLLRDVEPFQPYLYAGVTLALCVAVVLAALIPVGRALHINPLDALRVE